MSFFGSNSAATTAAQNTANATGDISKDVAISDPPTDGISDIAFSPVADYLSVASWDKKTRLYEIQPNGTSIGKASFDHEGPVLTTCWSKDGTKVVSAGADKLARVFDINTGQSSPCAVHTAPIKCARFVDVSNTQGPVLVTGSWDKNLKYWDLRSDQPIATLECQERIYTMDTKDKLLVVGTADRYINVINLNDPTKFYKTVQSPLKWQTRTVACFADASGFGVGSIEGRCAIQYVEEKDSALNFSFKCHRHSPPNQSLVSNVFAVNAINFHPVHGTFSTAGADSTFHFWDKDAKQRLKGYPDVGGQIPCTTFNRTGTIFAYAVSYDWSKGYTGSVQGSQNKVMLHAIQPDECKPRAKGTKR
ncbi:RNA export factor gle2 [Agyrium rufum]|nr:RNA export factor gle2 [Agyrium rufum]